MENPTAGQPSETQPTTTESNGSQQDNSERPQSKFSRFLSVFNTSKGPLGLLSNNPTTLKNLVLSSVTVGLEVLLNKEFFNCPLEDHKRYGLAFIFAPVFILFFANILIIGNIWELSSRCFIRRYQRRGECFARLIPDTFKALVGPGVWLLATFADTECYVCATVGPDAVKRNLTDGDEIKELENKMDAAKSTSHLWAWLVFVVMVTVCTILIVIKNCFLKNKVLLETTYDFERREAVQALNVFRRFIRGLPNKQIDGKNVVLGSKENVTLWVNGVPELTGEKEVEKIFKGWFDEDPDWSYFGAHEEFAKTYPRAKSGNPKDPWKAKQSQTSTNGRPSRYSSSSGKVTPKENVHTYDPHVEL